MEQAEILLKLAETGILGILLALALVAIGILYKDNRKLQTERINDLKETRDVVQAPLQAIKQTVDLILQSVNKK